MKKLYEFYYDEKWHGWGIYTIMQVIFAIITLPVTIFSFFVPQKGIENRLLYGVLAHVFIYMLGTMIVVVIDIEFGLNLAKTLSKPDRLLLIYSISFLVCGILYWLDKNLMKIIHGK